MLTFSIEPYLYVGSLEGVDLGSGLWTLGVNRHVPRHGRLLSLLSELDGSMALVGLHGLIEDPLLTVESPTNLALNL